MSLFEENGANILSEAATAALPADMEQEAATEEWFAPSVVDQKRPGRWKPQFTAGMLAQLKVIGGAVWSPDGNFIYFPQDFDGTCHIFSLEIKTGKLLQLSSDMPAGGLLTIAARAFDIAPDGSKLVYLGGKDSKLWLLPTDGGPATPLTSSEGSQTSATFSPNSQQVAYVQISAGNHDLAIVESDGQSWPRRISRGDAFVFDPQWFADGHKLAYCEYDNQTLPFAGTRLVIADLQTGEQKIVADGWAGGILYQQPRPSPDGKWLAYTSDETNWANVWLLNLASGEKHLLHPEPHEQAEPTWTPDSQRLLYTRNEDSSITVQTATLDGKVSTIDDTAGICNALALSPDGQKLCYVRQTPTLPTNLYLYDLKLDTLLRLTENTIGGLEKAGLVQPETVHWQSSDGLEIEGLLYLPANFQPGKHPALVHIHGGPIGQYNRVWQGVVQYLIGRGWVVIQPNFRGSTGYGREFRNKLNGAWGEADMYDNLGAVAYLKKHNLCHPTRIVAWGGSGGGYATMLLLSKWPDVFKAGVPLVGVSNFVSFPEQTDRFAKYLMHTILGPRADNFTIFEERSPVTFAHQVKAPMLILMGEKDFRVPAKQGDEMVEALKKAGISNFEYHVYPGEGHGWRKVETILDYVSRMEAFLEKWVLER